MPDYLHVSAAFMKSLKKRTKIYWQHHAKSV